MNFNRRDYTGKGPQVDRYTKRWKNKRALKRKALREKKYGSKNKGTEEYRARTPELIICSAVEAFKRGILADINHPNYSISSESGLLSGRAETSAQRTILNQLAIGDNVVFELSGENPVINGITARVSQLVRMRADASRFSLAGAEKHIIAANIDVAVIVASVVQPTFHPRLVDRYLIMCQYGNVKPLLCLTKIDLDALPDLSMYQNIRFPIIGVSNKTREGIDKLMPHLKNKRCVLVGKSGVGKSSLINTLLEKELLATREVSEKSGKGRHTTSVSSLHFLDNSTILIDTPGIRSLGLWNIDPTSLRLYFPEFIKFTIDCAFNDCTHLHEPRCAVKSAVEEGRIPHERYDSYVRLLEKN